MIFQLRSIWLGASQQAQIGNGTYNWESTGLEVGYTNWLGDQPERYGEWELCMAMISNDPGKWVEDSCDANVHSSMCEVILG